MSEFDHFIGTRPVSSKHAFDIAALSLAGAKPARIHRPAHGGVCSRAGNPTLPTNSYADSSYVMRAKPGPVAKLLPSAHAVEREFAVMNGLQGTDVPVPRMYCLCEDESVIGRAFYVMEFMQGRVLWDQSLPGMRTRTRRAIYNEMNRVISALHKVNLPQRGLENYGKPGNYFERQIGRWSKQYVASITSRLSKWTG
jgi:aminoglycoside phosphotransferase (APT) family kinase protein